MMLGWSMLFTNRQLINNSSSSDKEVLILTPPFNKVAAEEVARSGTGFASSNEETGKKVVYLFPRVHGPFIPTARWMKKAASTQFLSLPNFRAAK